MRSTVEQETWSVIRMIVRDLERVLDSADLHARLDLTIRMTAGLGTLAISDLEPVDASIEPEYRTSLLSERNVLRELLVRGARLRAVLNPAPAICAENAARTPEGSLGAQEALSGESASV